MSKARGSWTMEPESCAVKPAGVCGPRAVDQISEHRAQSTPTDIPSKKPASQSQIPKPQPPQLSLASIRHQGGVSPGFG
jgi:hypothetical protein